MSGGNTGLPKPAAGRAEWYHGWVLDTHGIARRLTDSGLPTKQVDPMTNILREAAEQGDHLTAEGCVLNSPASRLACGGVSVTWCSHRRSRSWAAFSRCSA